MELDLMFTGSESIVSLCRRPRRELMELVSTTTNKKSYGSTLEFIGVNVVFQDAGMIKLRTNLSRERKEIDVDLELSRKWIMEAEEMDIKLAFLQCLIKAAEEAQQQMTEEQDDFNAEELIADLKRVVDTIL